MGLVSERNEIQQNASRATHTIVPPPRAWPQMVTSHAKPVKRPEHLAACGLAAPPFPPCLPPSPRRIIHQSGPRPFPESPMKKIIVRSLLALVAVLILALGGLYFYRNSLI